METMVIMAIMGTMGTMGTMVIMAIMGTMGTMGTMEITTIMAIILTSMLHQKLQSLVEMVMALMEMAMGQTEMAMDPTEMDLMEMDQMETDPMEMDLMEMDQMETDPMEMDPMEMDPMDCAARSRVKFVNQSVSQFVRIIPLPAVKKSQPKSQLKSASRFPPKYAEMLRRTSPPRSARSWMLRSADQSPGWLTPQLKRKCAAQQHARSV